MIVSHRHRFIFLKTMKTAGTSVEIALSRFCGEDDIITPITEEDEAVRAELGYPGPRNYVMPFAQYGPRDWGRLVLKGRRLRLYNHSPAHEVRRVLGPGVWNRYFKFCFERDPWDKAISLYYWRFREGPRPSLSDYLRSPEAGRMLRWGGAAIYRIGDELAVDHVGRYEDLEVELGRIAERLGLPDRPVLPRVKGGVRKDRRSYREVLSEEDMAAVAERCSDVIELMGYERAAQP